MFLGLVISCQARNRPMNQEPEQSKSNGGNRGVNLVLGIFFTIGWIFGLCYLGVFVLMADVMAVASDSAAPRVQTRLLDTGGEILRHR